MLLFSGVIVRSEGVGDLTSHCRFCTWNCTLDLTNCDSLLKNDIHCQRFLNLFKRRETISKCFPEISECEFFLFYSKLDTFTKPTDKQLVDDKTLPPSFCQ